MNRSADLTIELERGERNRVTVRPAGEIDMHNVGLVERHLDRAIEEGAHRLIVDLERVSFLDSSGIRCIVRAAQSIQEANGQLHIVNASGAVRRVLEITGVIERLRVAVPEC